MAVDPIALSESGGWAVAVAMGISLGVGFVRGWLVPGFVYRREVERGDKADTAAERNADQIRDLVTLLRDGDRKRG